MSKEQSKGLLKFLKPFCDDKTQLVMWLRDFAWDLHAMQKSNWLNMTEFKNINSVRITVKQIYPEKAKNY